MIQITPIALLSCHGPGTFTGRAAAPVMVPDFRLCFSPVDRRAPLVAPAADRILFFRTEATIRFGRMLIRFGILDTKIGFSSTIFFREPLALRLALNIDALALSPNHSLIPMHFR